MPKTLVIVESPAKARTIEKYLGGGYVVESSIGHIRDLPRSASEIPEKYKGQAWARLGINVDEDFRPLYVVASEKKQQVAKLRGLLKEADEVVLATDDDREGESIAWHLLQELKPKVPVRRMVFHEITKEAIENAIRNSRAIDENLVEAQEARRALDRLYGYEVSPVLWKKVAPKLSAGRVQSVATRMLVERERERMRFNAGTWWDLEGRFAVAVDVSGLRGAGRPAPSGDEHDGAGKAVFPATLIEVAGTRLATGKDFDPATGRLKAGAAALLLNEQEANALAAGLAGQPFEVLSAEEKPFTQRPYAPFITSTLQQEGGRKLGMSAARTMRAAQKLYEGGYITYMRTDSTTLSREAMDAARAQVRDMYGQAYLHPTPRTYDKKSKNAQEAHEAIRPAGSSFRTPDSLRGELGGDEWRLYDLIWKRTVASQMADARGRRLQVRLGGRSTDGRDAVFAASGRAIDFPGFLRAYVEGADDPDAALEDREVLLPPLTRGDRVTARELKAASHTTQPPARFTEASLVQALEQAGIGRPSTYASILGTIQERGYAMRRGQALVPTWTAFATSALLEHHFGRLVDYDFTARMEEALDDIAGGRQKRTPYLRSFYYGDTGGLGLKRLVETRLEAIDAREIATIEVPRLRGSGIEVRVGRFGPYMQRGEQKANLPEDLAPDELGIEKAEEILARPSGERPLGTDPNTDLPVIARAGRFGPYVQLGEGNTPVRTSSLLPGDDLNTLTLDRALKLLSLPRFVGTSEGEEVWAHNGRYGPYLKRGGDTRNLASPEELFTVTLSQAEALFMQPRARGGRAARGPLRRFEYEGRDAIELRAGRFGAYLTDGSVNATLRDTEDPETMTADEAREIVEERGRPPKGKPARAKKAAPKKTAAKKPATTTKKTAGAAATKPAAKRAAPRTTKGKTSAKTTTKTAARREEKSALSWAELKPHVNVLSDTERRLVMAVRDEGRKVEEVAPELGLDVKKAKGMNLQASKKLNQAARSVA
ncbi:type I DNA topoisomerase [Deinococcus pimensis]|uniref:type I DNA topoisomerase n=1 Tax=Deinococcus pimensis TaxID=309888 RepID=UPI000481A446|nr:type I DNA topoisomerase [Deinococcus pimensis]